MRKLLFRCLVLATVFTMVGCSDDLSVLCDPEQSSVETVGQEEICVDQSKALEAFSNLKDFYGLKTRSVQDENKPIYFPDYYGGSYIDGNKLVVYIKSGTENLPAILTDNPNIILKESDFSFNYLSDVLSDMNKIYLSSEAKLNPVIENIEMFGLSETNNRIEVYLYDCSNTAISDFKHYIMDSPAICFIQSRCQQEDFVNFMECLKSSTFRANFTVNPGSSIGASPDIGLNLTPGSLGYKATYNNKTGFVTAAHVAALNDYVSIIYDTNKSNPIGRCLYSNRSGSVDVAFCDLSEENCTITNNISGNTSKVLSGEAYPEGDIKEGLTVYLAGSKNQSQGVIKQVSISSGGLSNLIAASYSSQDGDSGGVVYCTKNGKNYIVGLHRARATWALSTNIHNISKLGISPSK
jgi:hypothetical protein